jgi:hypothetical protein
MITAPPTKQAPTETHWVVVWILRLVSELRLECAGATALSTTGSQTGAATMTITKTNSNARVHHGAVTVPMRCATLRYSGRVVKLVSIPSSPAANSARAPVGSAASLFPREASVAVECRRLRATCHAPYAINTSASVRSTPREARSEATRCDVAAPIRPIAGMPKATRQTTAPPAKRRPAAMPAAPTTREAFRNNTGLTAAISTSGRLCAKKVARVTGES